MKVLVIDPKIAGISGDMLLAALIDLTGYGKLLDPLADAIEELAWCGHFSYKVRDVDAGGISSKKLEIDIRETIPRDPDEMRRSAEAIGKKIGLSETAREKAESIIGDLLEADAKIHRSGFSHRDVASVAALFDVFGSLSILDRHGFFKGEIYGTSPALGSGLTRIMDCDIACPAPATLEILCRHRVPYSTIPADTELSTPTGVAIFANLAGRIVDAYPPMTPVNVGYGTGSRSIPGRPSVLRVVEGTNFDAHNDRIVMLETNLDDTSGETVGYTVERLRKAGAIDVYVTSASGKKNRPVQILHIITDHLAYTGLMEILMEETGTLGVRILDIPRLVANRSRQSMKITIEGQEFEIRVKTSTVDGRIIARKPEYEDLKKIALTLNIPLREARELVLSAIR